MKRKLFAFDIDGTILNSEKQPLDSTREALSQLRKQGHLVTIATGRSRYLAHDIIRDLEFTNYIVCNGSAAFLDHEQIYKNLLNKAALRRLIAQLNKQKIDTAMISMDGIYRNSSNDIETMSTAMNSFGGTLPEYNPNYLEEQEVYQSLAFFPKEADGKYETDFPEFRFVRWHEQSVDIIPKNGSKAATIMFMAERLGIEKEDVIAFGDADNDIEMLQTAGVGVAMGNAKPEIQAVADMVTSSNDSDGIWSALKKLAVL